MPSKLNYWCGLFFHRVRLLYFICFYRLWREAAEVTLELEVAQAETQRLQDVLASKEQDVQRLRELVAQQMQDKAEKRSEWKQMVAQKVEMAENKDEVQKEMDGIRHSELKVSLSNHIKS